MCGGGGGVQDAKIFFNDQSRSLGAPLAKCLEILCAAMPYSAAWMDRREIKEILKNDFCQERYLYNIFNHQELFSYLTIVIQC